MMTMLDFTLGLLAYYEGTSAARQVWRVRRTLDWVERSCRADGHPDEIVRLVRSRFEAMYTRDPWAVTLPDDDEESEASA